MGRKAFFDRVNRFHVALVMPASFGDALCTDF